MNALNKSIGTILPAIRISFTLVLLTTCIFLAADLLGFTPKEANYVLDSRKKVSEALAIQFSILTSVQDIKKTQKLIRYIVKYNPDILSAGIRLTKGNLIFQSGNHKYLWKGYDEKKSTSTHVLIPIIQHGSLWANVELRFESINEDSFLGFFKQPIVKMTAFILLIGFFVYLVFMLRILRQLDPSAVIPERVNAAFDTLSEGLIILDEKEQIILSNKAFSDKIDRSPTSLLGVKMSELNWAHISAQKSGSGFPWDQVIKSGNSSVGSHLLLKTSKGIQIKFALNTSAISGNKDRNLGVLITLNDMTEVETHNSKLQSTILQLKKSTSHVEQQNKELHYLATRDPMTGCLNRRSFSEKFEELFSEALEQDLELSCFMVDLDHFKLVNDNYGHGVGDEVIKLLAEILHSNTRKVDVVGRYGGEEFCVVLPGLKTDEAFIVAERIRIRIKDESSSRFKDGPLVTASIGVASILNPAETPSDLNNLADNALYTAKESGRNLVIIWKPENATSLDAEKTEPENPVESNNAVDSTKVINLQNRIDQLENIASKFSAELEYNNSYDALTGLPNQILFYDRVTQAIERGFRHDQLAAVFIFDLDMFGQINSTFGRSIGDQLLRTIAERLETIFRKSDNISRLTISRVAGDEFAIFLSDLTGKEQVTWTVKRLLDEINNPILIDNHKIHLSSHVGISLYPTDANTPEELLNNAMTAKQHCKSAKSDFNYQFFDPQMQDLSIKHLHLDKELRHSIENENWQLFYQLKWDIKQKKITGVEALIRWNHPIRNTLAPLEFIDFAEQRGLIIPIGDWVIKKACKQMKEWMDIGIYDCKIAINLSSVQLMQSDITHKIFSTLETYSVPPRLLELEITETTLMNNLETAIESLRKLNARGINIAIDDFGTGYSSLGYLKNLPINTLKIDKSFIKDICNDDNDQKIVQPMISMAHSMGMTVVAEGVEEKEQLDLLSQYSCDEIQGYLLSKPIPANEMIKILRDPQKIIDII
ncbi:MAG: diguanylate cyclase [Methylococcales bacterium]|nr:diguanylate cyclase [Methylococcales bacterium]